MSIWRLWGGGDDNAGVPSTPALDEVLFEIEAFEYCCLSENSFEFVLLLVLLVNVGFFQLWWCLPLLLLLAVVFIMRESFASISADMDIVVWLNSSLVSFFVAAQNSNVGLIQTFLIQFNINSSITQVNNNHNIRIYMNK